MKLYISAVAYALGERRPLVELATGDGAEQAMAQGGPRCYRRWTGEPSELAASAGRASIVANRVVPDLVLYSSEGRRSGTTGGDAGAAVERMGLAGVPFLALSGHVCANLAPALATGRAMIAAGEAETVLVLTSECIEERFRLMPGGFGVKSDGAAACVLSRCPADSGGRFLLRGLSYASDVRTNVYDSGRSALVVSRALARKAAARLCGPGDQYRLTILNNYADGARDMFAALSGFGRTESYRGSVDDAGHCYAADTLISLSQLVQEERLVPGERLLLIPTGPRTWGFIDLEVR